MYILQHTGRPYHVLGGEKIPENKWADMSTHKTFSAAYSAIVRANQEHSRNCHGGNCYYDHFRLVERTRSGQRVVDYDEIELEGLRREIDRDMREYERSRK